jgi:hypothetical protein
MVTRRIVTAETARTTGASAGCAHSIVPNHERGILPEVSNFERLKESE